ncbi:MAG: single-stranded DNA-binding protein [Hyphomicrobiales bacterium]|nr:single-stranded DNA-binding protein [Hyphomicrobiales bacterium]
MFNRATLIGNVGRDPEVRKTGNGDSVVSFSVATSESWRDKASGERKEKTTWHNVVIWNEGIGKIAEQYVRKGSRVMVEGRIEHREYNDKDGNKRTSTEIVLQRFNGELKLLSGKDERSDDAAPREQRSTSRDDGASSSGTRRSTSAAIDDDIPF